MSKRKVRLPLRSQDLRQPKIEVVGDDFTYLCRVHRLKIGDTVRCFNGTGFEADAVIEDKKARSLILKILRAEKTVKVEGPRIGLAQAITKAGKMGDIIRKATELGVYEIIPFIAKRSIGRLSADEEETKRKRWQKIAAQASRQSERSIIPIISSLVSFTEVIDNLNKYDYVIILWEGEKVQNLKEVLRKHVGDSTESIAICVGPEGGFTEKEIDLAQKQGFLTASLGPRILRTETTSLAVLSILQYEYGDIG